MPYERQAGIGMPPGAEPPSRTAPYLGETAGDGVSTALRLQIHGDA